MDYIQKVLKLFEESDSWPYTEYDSFEQFMSVEDPSFERIEKWTIKFYGKAQFDELMAMFGDGR